MKISLLLLYTAFFAYQVLAAPSSDSKILKTLQKQKTASVIVSIKGSKIRDLLNQVQQQSFTTRAQKITSIHNVLKSHSEFTQANVLRLLNRIKSEKPIVIRQLWISNEILVKNADLSVVESLLAMDEVTKVIEEEILPFDKPLDFKVVPEGEFPHEGEQWGVKAVRANEAWAMGNRGKGAVIGIIDSGARATHESLKGSFRRDHGWYDPQIGSYGPNDQHGHGTHVTGIIAGQANGIGVAPDAQWIACKACNSVGCAIGDLKWCGQFMFCPTDPYGEEEDCSKAPNAVSNSWGDGQGNPFYNDVLDVWSAADIAPIFAIGNSGSRCGTANSPGDNIQAIGVGSMTESNDISYFSSVGPTVDGNRIKPDIVAPGSYVVSSIIDSDTSYGLMSGTSMACPHAAGLAALLYAEKPDLTVAQLRAALIAGAQPINPSGANCGGIPETEYPNHVAGHGVINAVVSLDNLKRL